jgi:hypothetical protein
MTPPVPYGHWLVTLYLTKDAERAPWCGWERNWWTESVFGKALLACYTKPAFERVEPARGGGWNFVPMREWERYGQPASGYYGR